MSREDRRQLAIKLAQQGLSIRQISRTLSMARKTVRRVLKEDVKEKDGIITQHMDLIRSVFKQCKGNAVRVQEVLQQDHNLEIGYSTLTRALRDYEIRKPKPPVGTYHFEPGEEMQFDTSPHRVTLGEKTKTLQCATLVLAHSRYLFARYYPCFTRFEAKWFLSDALVFMDGSARRCLVDNTCVVVAGGTGPDALISPEMNDFARLWGTRFEAHRLRHPQRKARVERSFHTIENNFLVGRMFRDIDDLNQQLEQWCREVANGKIKRALNMSPQAAYLTEKPYLQPMPPHLPPLYVSDSRLVDTQGYVCLDTNRYSMPQRYRGKRVLVHKHPRVVRIYADDKCIAEHPRFLEKCRGQNTIAGHHDFTTRKKARALSNTIENELRGHNEILDRYIDELKKRAPGRGTTRLKRLTHLWRTYPAQAFYPALEKALHYGLFDLARLDNMILRNIGGDFFQLPGDDSCD
jgi:transposase